MSDFVSAASLLVILVGAFGVVALIAVTRWSFVVAQPDEWLLRVRNGQLVDAGVGISLWRLPGDVVVRFTSTIQRVRFEVQALSREHLGVALEGFVLWTIAADGPSALRAYSRLGIANLDHPPEGLKSRKHLMTGPQHRAFQGVIGGEVQQHVATLEMEVILSSQRDLVAGLAARLGELADTLGFRIEQVEILRVRPVDERYLEHLAALQSERARAEAERARAATERGLRLEAVEAERAVDERKALAAGERLRAEEEQASARLLAQQAREEKQLVARLDGLRRTAQAERDAMLERVSAEERKSVAVRAHELARYSTEQIAAVLAAMPIRDARWVSVGADSPMSSVAGLLAAARELVRSDSSTGPTS